MITGLLYNGRPLVINVEGPLSVGEIIGIVVGCIGAVGVAIGVIILIRRKKKLYQPL